MQFPLGIDENEMGIGGHSIAVEEAVVAVEMEKGPSVAIATAGMSQETVHALKLTVATDCDETQVGKLVVKTVFEVCKGLELSDAVRVIDAHK